MINQLIFASTLLLLTLLFLFLTRRVILFRRRFRVPYSHQVEDKHFMASISAQRNFIDYTSISLIFLLFLMSLTINPYLFLILNACLVVGRYLHAYGLLHLEQLAKPNFRGRVIGMALTLITITVSVIFALVLTIAAAISH